MRFTTEIFDIGKSRNVRGKVYKELRGILFNGFAGQMRRAEIS